MKRYILILSLLLISSAAIAQKKRDVIHLKNGSLIKGKITEQLPPDHLKIETADGSVFVYKYEEIEKITREEVKEITSLNENAPPDSLEYGGAVGLGFALGGGAVFGLPVRVYLTRKIVFETGIYLRPLRIEVEGSHYNSGGYYSQSYDHYSEEYIKIPPYLIAGFDFFFNEKYHPRTKKIIKNGVMIRAGRTLGGHFSYPVYTYDYDTYSVIESTLDSSFSMFLLTAGYARERFKIGNKKSCYNFELGFGVTKFKGINSQLGVLTKVNIYDEPLIYFKFHWNFFLK